MLQLSCAASLNILTCFDWPISHTVGTKTCQAPISHAAWLWSCSLVLSSKKVSLGCLCNSKCMFCLAAFVLHRHASLPFHVVHASLLSTKDPHAPKCHNTQCMNGHVCLLSYSLQHLSHNHRALYAPQNLSTKYGLCMHIPAEQYMNTRYCMGFTWLSVVFYPC